MKCRQQGQVLPMGLALLAIMLMGVFVLYSTGQVATDKVKLANAADAAAYSGSLWQARAMNFQAYTNRAMVANQVSMAQAVTLQSWASYGVVASENISTVVKPVPVLNAVAQGMATGFSGVEKVLSPVSSALLKVVNLVNRGLSVSQEAMFLSTFVATPDIVRAVVNESDQRFNVNTAYSGLGIANNLNDWYSFSKRYSDDDTAEMQSRALMINQSRDAFTQERNWKFFKNFWFYTTPITRHRLYREGSTELVLVENGGEAQWEWKAKDTLSLHNRLWRWRGTKRYEIPVGWAEAFANSESASRTIEPGACTTALQFQQSDHCSRFLSMNRNAEYMADIGMRSPFSRQQTRVAMSGFSGIQAFRTLSAKTLNEEIPRVQLKVEVSMPAESISSADTTDLGDTFKSPVSTLGNVVSSISTAEMFYQRPDSDSSTTMEKATAYNPYWSARLSPIAQSDRLLATGFRGATGSLSAPGQLSSEGLSRYSDATQSPETFDSVVASRDVAAVSRYENIIQDELNTALADSIKQLLGGAGQSSNSLLGDELPSAEQFQQHAENSLADSIDPSAAQSYQAVVADAERLAAELENEFARIRQQVSEEFDLAYAQIRSDLDTEIADIHAQVRELRQNLADQNQNEEAIRDTESRIATLQTQAVELESGFNSRLATRLVEIVNNTTNLYSMPYEEALFAVKEWRRNDEDEISLRWAEVTDED